jgi:hypothetical protein
MLHSRNINEFFFFAANDLTTDSCCITFVTSKGGFILASGMLAIWEVSGELIQIGAIRLEMPASDAKTATGRSIFCIPTGMLIFEQSVAFCTSGCTKPVVGHCFKCGALY